MACRGPRPLPLKPSHGCKDSNSPSTKNSNSQTPAFSPTLMKSACIHAKRTLPARPAADGSQSHRPAPCKRPAGSTGLPASFRTGLLRGTEIRFLRLCGNATVAMPFRCRGLEKMQRPGAAAVIPRPRTGASCDGSGPRPGQRIRLESDLSRPFPRILPSSSCGRRLRAVTARVGAVTERHGGLRSGPHCRHPAASYRSFSNTCANLPEVTFFNCSPGNALAFVASICVRSGGRSPASNPAATNAP